MTFKKLCKELTKREGKKRGVDIANMTEIMSCLSDIIFENFANAECLPAQCTECGVDGMFYDLGEKRAKKKFERDVKKINKNL